MTDKYFNFQGDFVKSMEEALKSRGIVNILIAGKTGVGKSTLINAVFQGKMADTGQGSPVTQHTRRITKEGVPVSIYDTKGLELKDYKPIVEELLSLVTKKNRCKDPQEHIHVAWLCIAESSRRVEDAELILLKQLSAQLPVIVVITTAVSDAGFKKTVDNLMPEARNVVRINSLPVMLDGGYTVPIFGLEELIKITMDVIPDGQKKAFAAAQCICLEEKVKQARIVVATASVSAGGIGAIPIPFSDAIAIVPIQIGMLAGISAAFGLDISDGFLGTVISSTFSGLAGTMAGRAAVAAFLKFIPGAGSLAGGMMSAAVATSLTATFGMAYIATLEALLKDDPDRKLSAEDVANAFKERMSA